MRRSIKDHCLFCEEDHGTAENSDNPLSTGTLDDFNISDLMMKEEYNQICTEDDCFKTVKEDDIERDSKGNIYERSKKCWDCRTDADKRAIKKFRRLTRRKFK